MLMRNEYLPALLNKRGKSDTDVPVALAYLESLVEPIGQDGYGFFEAEARQRLRDGMRKTGRCLPPPYPSPDIWTEDTDFFGAGVAV